jgi:DNA-binding transcriptional LysR family regulator
VPVSGTLRTNSAALIRAAGLEGRGIIVAPAFFVDAELRSGALVRVLPDYYLNEFPLIALYLHREHVPAKLRAFLDFAARHFAADPQWQITPGARKPTRAAVG